MTIDNACLPISLPFCRGPDKMTVGQCDVLLRLAFEQKHISNFGVKEVRLRAWVCECHTILQEQAGPTMHSIQLY